MSSRSYDFILKLADTSSFSVGNSVLGVSSNAFGQVIAKDSSNLKVKVANSKHYFISSENIISNVTVNTSATYQQSFTSTPIVIDSNSYSINGTSNTFALPHVPSHKAEIEIYADNVFIESEKYVWPSTVLDGVGVDFKDIETVTFPAANDRAIVTSANFPTTGTTSLTLKISTGDKDSLSFLGSNTPTTQIQTGSSTITTIYPSNFVLNRNAFEEEPIVRLYSIYYPGEWYPANDKGNPTGEGAGRPWPYGFPIRYAEIIGEDFSIEDYTITHQSNNYVSFPINYPGISISSDGSIGEIDLEISSIDLALPTLVEDPFLVGYNNTSAISSTVNGEVLTNIDPRTVLSNPSYDSDIADSRGQNQPYDYNTTSSLGEEWISLMPDSRDLLGAVVEVRSYYASSLEYWPEFSIISGVSGDSIRLESTAPYRVGDTVNSNVSTSTATITNVYSNNYIKLDQSITGAVIGDKLLINNSNYDPDAYVERKFTINKLNSYNDSSISFNLGSRTTNLLKEVPRRKFYKNTCPWKYKGVECKYPSGGTGVISNSVLPKTANGMFTINNVATSDPNLDKCSKSISACKLRNNLLNWGGFPGVRNKV